LIASFAALSLVAYFAAPFHIATWAYFSPRFAFLGLAIAPLAIDPSQFENRSLTRAVTLMVVCFDAAAIVWAFHFERAMEPLVSEALSGVDAPIRRDGPRLPLILAREPEMMTYVEPLAMIGHLYLFDQGGIDPYLWADRPLIDAILYKDSPRDLFGPHPGRFMRQSLLCAGKTADCPPIDVQYEWYTVWGRTFQDVILYSGDPRALETFLRRGYDVDFKRQRLAILHASTCRFIVRVSSKSGSSSLPGMISIHAGRSGLDAPTNEGMIPAGVVIPPDGLAVVIEGKDCGPMWLEVQAPSSPSCVEANERGRILIDVRRDEIIEARCSLP
jgi:hypothetical protein